MSENKELYLDFEEYLKASEPHKREKAEAWKVAIGLQAVDGLKVSGIWQIHPFREGNTRTTAVFTIKYLQSIGFKTDNRMFEEYSWYFRNALVRANYKNVVKGISQDAHFLELFFRNLLMGENNELKNRYLLVNPPEEWLQSINTEQAPHKYPTSAEQVTYRQS